MGAVMEEQEAIFGSAGQAVHVAFLVLAQEATQDAPFRKALIKAMESVPLAPGQRHWLDQLRGDGTGSCNFGGLSTGDIRAQCAMITQAVRTKLPATEMWVLQAKYGQTEFEDVAPDDSAADSLSAALVTAEVKVQLARERVAQARTDFTRQCDVPWVSLTRAARPGQPSAFLVARDGLSDANHALADAESEMQLARIALARVSSSALIDNGRPAEARQARRRWAFSPERIEAIKGLSEWFAPMFPRIKPLALDCMLGRMFANHKKIDISTRDLAAQFGGNHTKYLRASWKMKNHLRTLEELAIARLEPIFVEQGVSIELE